MYLIHSKARPRCSYRLQSRLQANSSPWSIIVSTISGVGTSIRAILFAVWFSTKVPLSRIYKDISRCLLDMLMGCTSNLLGFDSVCLNLLFSQHSQDNKVLRAFLKTFPSGL
ncbi:hypothetical protein BDV10DRAFT_63176 [Aspergillus recurvatus]